MKLPAVLQRRRKLSYAAIGVFVIVGVLLALVASYEKQQIQTWLLDGQYRTIQFDGTYFLFPDVGDVKIAGIDVGTIDSVEPGPNNSALVHVKVKNDALDKVGSAPSALIRPTTLLAGIYYIDLRPGGDRTKSWTGMIPRQRTRLPVELDKVTETFQPDAIAGAKASVNQFDAALTSGGRQALDQLVADAPDTLRPASRVLEALRGTRPRTDLRAVVGNLQSTSAVLTRKQDQLQRILDDFETTGSVFSDTAEPVARAIDRLPATLDTADRGLARLDTTLNKLRRTAGPARPSVQELSTTLDRVDPVLAEARPVVNDLRVALRDTRPVVENLVPASSRATSTLNDLRGPVLDRVNGPITNTVLSPFDGTGYFKHTSGKAPFYKEFGYMLSGLSKAGAYVDKNGHAVAFQPGVGPGSLADAPVSLENLYANMFFPGGGR